MRKTIIVILIILFGGVILGILSDYFFITPQKIYSYILGNKQKETFNGYDYGESNTGLNIVEDQQQDLGEDDNKIKENPISFTTNYKNDIISSGEAMTRKEFYDNIYNNIDRPEDYGSIGIEDQNLYEECDLSKINLKQKGDIYNIPCDNIRLSIKYIDDYGNKNISDNFTQHIVNIYDGDTLIIKGLMVMGDEVNELSPYSIKYSKDLGIAYWTDPEKQGDYGDNILVYSTKTLSYKTFIYIYSTEISISNDHQKVAFSLFPGDITAKGVDCKTVDYSSQNYPITKCKYTYKVFMLPYLTRASKDSTSYQNFMDEENWKYQKDIPLYILPSERTISCYDDDAGGTCNYWMNISYNISTSQITRNDHYKKVILNIEDLSNFIQE